MRSRDCRPASNPSSFFLPLTMSSEDWALELDFCRARPAAAHCPASRTGRRPPIGLAVEQFWPPPFVDSDNSEAVLTLTSDLIDYSGFGYGVHRECPKKDGPNPSHRAEHPPPDLLMLARSTVSGSSNSVWPSYLRGAQRAETTCWSRSSGPVRQSPPGTPRVLAVQAWAAVQQDWY